jgi:uncharacterized membrane protein/rubrerythrin
MTSGAGLGEPRAEEVRVMTFLDRQRFEGRTMQEMLKVSWEGEIYGVGMMEELAKRYPEHADHATACATMEWFNVHRCEEFGHEVGVYVTLEQAEKLGREGAELVRRHSFKSAAKLTAAETPAADKMYEELAKLAENPELKAFAGHLDDHENALRDWLKSELDGKSDGAEKVFAYLERYGITRKDAVIPREEREDYGGDKQQLVLAFFDTEDAADQAAKALRDWEKATEYMKVDAVGVLVKGDDGKVKEHKLGKRAGKRGMGIGVALGLIAAIPSGGLSLVGGVLGGAAGGGVIGQFFHKGLKMTDEDTARIGRELDAGHAAVGVLTWDFETEAVSQKLTGLGGTPETHEVAKPGSTD